MDPTPLDNLIAHVDQRINFWERFMVEHTQDSAVDVYTLMMDLEDIAELVKAIPHDETK